MQETRPYSEQELAQEIIHLKDDTGLGFRKIAKELTTRGLAISKDRAHRLYWKYKEPEDFGHEEDEELTQLRKEEEERARRLRLSCKKEEKRKSIARLIVEELVSSYAKRKQVFIYKDKMLEFAERVIPVVDPQLWDDFRWFSAKRGYNLKDALALVFGTQRDYEAQAVNGSSERQRLDAYICERIRERLELWTRRMEDEDEEDEEPSLEASKPEDATQWIDDQGYFHILLPAGDNEDYYD